MSDDAIHRSIKNIKHDLDQIKVSERPGIATAYTPTYFGSVTAGTTTYTTQDGDYMQIGKLVIVWGYVVWTAATGTGNARISLPFTCSSALPRVAVAVVLDSVTFANSAPEGLIIGGNNFLELYSPLSNAAPNAVGVEAAGQIAFTAVYSQ